MSSADSSPLSSLHGSPIGTPPAGEKPQLFSTMSAPLSQTDDSPSGIIPVTGEPQVYRDMSTTTAMSNLPVTEQGDTANSTLFQFQAPAVPAPLIETLHSQSATADFSFDFSAPPQMRPNDTVPSIGNSNFLGGILGSGSGSGSGLAEVVTRRPSESDMSDSSVTIRRLELENNELQIAYQELVNQVSRPTLATSTREIARTKAAEKHLQRELDIMTRRVKEHERHLQDYETEALKLRSDAKGRIQLHKEEFAKWQAEIKNLEIKNSDLRQNFDINNRVIAPLKSRRAGRGQPVEQPQPESSQSNTTQTTDIELLCQLNHVLRGQVAQLESTSANQDSLLTRVTSHAARAAQLKNLESKLLERMQMPGSDIRSAEYAKMGNVLLKTQADLLKANALSETIIEVAGAREAINELTENFNKQLTNYHAQVFAYSEELTRLQEKNEVLEKSSKTLQDDLEMVQSAQELNEQNIEALEKEIADLKADKTKLGEDLQASEAEVANLLKRIDELKEANHVLETQDAESQLNLATKDREEKEITRQLEVERKKVQDDRKTMHILRTGHAQDRQEITALKNELEQANNIRKDRDNADIFAHGLQEELTGVKEDAVQVHNRHKQEIRELKKRHKQVVKELKAELAETDHSSREHSGEAFEGLGITGTPVIRNEGEDDHELSRQSTHTSDSGEDGSRKSLGEELNEQAPQGSPEVTGMALVLRSDSSNRRSPSPDPAKYDLIAEELCNPRPRVPDSKPAQDALTSLEKHPEDNAGANGPSESLPSLSSLLEQLGQIEPGEAEAPATPFGDLVVNELQVVLAKYRFLVSILSPLLFLMLLFLVASIMSYNGEKQLWIASNELTRRMTLSVSAGGPTGYRLLSWLLGNDFLEISNMSYG